MRRFRRRLRSGAFLGLLIVVMGAGQAPNSPPVSGSVPAAKQASAPAQPPALVGPGAMDVPLRLLAEARQSYQQTRDYTCLFIKRERLRGELQPENVIAMKARTQPFSVYMRWLKPTDLVGQEVCYVAGRNNGMMRAHSTGVLGAVGFVSMDPRDPRALENSRHTITEAGIGSLIDRFDERWALEKRLNKTWVRNAEYEYNKRRCIRVDTLHPDNSGKQFLFYRTILYFDRENRLPIRIENYDWPRAGGDPNGDLAECYSYADLRLNVGLSEATFNH